jgi:hypothetical protein
MSIASVTLPVGRSAFVAEQLWSLGILAVLCLLLALLRLIAKTQSWQYKRFKEKNAVTSRSARRGGNLNDDQKQFVKWSRTHWTNVFVGTDGRLSTSKTMAILWTFALAYMLLVMGLIAAAASEPGNTLSALISPTSGLYLVLIGGPFAAAVLAKATVSTGTATGRLQKSYSASTNLTDIIANDQGNTDLVDSQYTLFNLIALTIVLVAFIRKPGFGAPVIPGFLAGLTGASAATYAANKAAISNAPVIAQVIPAVARIGQRVIAHGTNLHAAAADDATTTVTVGGFQATVEPQEVQADHVTFTIPSPTAGTYPSDRPVGVAITTVAGATAVKPDGITVLEDKITITGTHPKSVQPGHAFTIFGSGLFDAAELAPAGTPASDAKGPTVTLSGPATVECSYPGNGPSSTDNDSHISVTVPDGTAAGNYNLAVQRSGLTAPGPGEPENSVEVLGPAPAPV